MCEQKRVPKRYAINIEVGESSKEHYGSTRDFPPARESAKYLYNFFKDTLEFHNESILIPKDSPESEPNEATVSRFVDEMDFYSKEMVEGDLLVLTFCGHTYKANESLDPKNDLNRYRGWGFYDRIFFHFEIWELIKQFKPGTRIVIISDSCFSGVLGMKKAQQDKAWEKEMKERESEIWFNNPESKAEYIPVFQRAKHPEFHTIPPSVVVLTASTLNQIILPRNQRNQRTVFSDAFESSWNLRQDSHSLSTLFDDLFWFMELDLVLSDLYACKRKNMANNKELHKARVSPQWQYIQGHKRTDLRAQKPAFKIGNN